MSLSLASVAFLIYAAKMGYDIGYEKCERDFAWRKLKMDIEAKTNQ